MGIDAIIALVGLLAPPIIDFGKKLFLKPDKDTPEATMSALATTKPEALGAYVEALAKYLKTQIDNFNRDIAGTPRQWIVDMRAAIRPIGTIGSMIILAVMAFMALTDVQVDPTMKDTVDGVRYTCEGIASSWFGSRISLSK